MFGKAKGNQGGSGNSRSKATYDKDRIQDQIIDASPGDKQRSLKTSLSPITGMRNSKACQDSLGTARRMWRNYVNMLSRHFHRMSRHSQEQFIIRLSQIITLGTTVLLTSIFYSFVPRGIRVLAVPVLFVGAWWAGTHYVGPQLIIRFGKSLNPEEEDEEEEEA